MKSLLNSMQKLYRYLSNTASGIVKRTVKVLNVPSFSDAIGFTLKGDKIFVSYDHPLFNGLTEAEKNMIRLGVTVHEALHQVFTNFRYFEETVNNLRRAGYFLSAYDEQMFCHIQNLIEDPAIETMAPQRVGGLPLKALQFTIVKLDEISSASSEAAQDEVHELCSALVQFGDVGIVRMEWTFEKAHDAFLQIAPMFYEAINEPDGKKRIDAVKPILEIVRTLYRSEAAAEDLKDIGRSSAPQGTGSGKTGKAPSEDSDLNRRRKVTIKKLKRDEWEKKKKEQEEEGSTAPDDGKSDLTIYVPEEADEKDKKEEGKDEGSSIPMPGGPADKENGDEKTRSSSSEKTDVDIETDSDSEDPKDAETSDDKEEKADTDGSTTSEESDSAAEDGSKGSPEKKSESKADGSSEKKDDTGSGKDTSDSADGSDEDSESSSKSKSEAADPKSSMRGKPEEGLTIDMSDPGHCESEEDANPFELTDEDLDLLEIEEADLPDADLDRLMSAIDAVCDDTEEPAEGMKDSDREPIDYSDVIAKELHTSATCINKVVKYDPKSAWQYEAIIKANAELIALLKERIREIILNDGTKTYFAQSGKVRLGRMITHPSSTMIFERKERSKNKGSIVIYIMVDMSGSTCGIKIEQEQLAVIIITEALSEFDIPICVTGFTDRAQVELYHFVRWDNTEEERMSLLKIRAMSENFDAYAVRYAEKELLNRSEKRKLFIMVSDGQPCSPFSGGEAGIRQNAETVAHMKEAGIDVLAFGVGKVPKDRFEYMYGKDSFIDVSDPTELSDKIAVALENVINGNKEGY